MNSNRPPLGVQSVPEGPGRRPDGVPASGSLCIGVWGLGVLGPGLAGWAQTAACLADPSSWVGAPTALPAPARLPAAERRRAGSLVKLSLGVADQALEMAASAGRSIDLSRLATVFSSSSGDAQNCHAMCEALAAPERALSPTRFTNSVHNATAGYWHIATASRAPSTSLCGFDASFAAGLLEAAAQVAIEGRPVLLVASDTPYPHPLQAQRPTPDGFGVAFVLAPVGSGDASTATLLRIEPGRPKEPVSSCAASDLEALRRAIPAARSLPLLEAIALQRETRVVIEGQGAERLVVLVNGSAAA